VKSQFIVILELVVVLNKGIYEEKKINVCCNLKKGLYLGTKKKQKGVISRDEESISISLSLTNIFMLINEK